MSYQQFLSSTSNAKPSMSPASTPSSIHRKPLTSSVRSASPTSSSINQTPSHPYESSPLSSFPPQSVRSNNTLNTEAVDAASKDVGATQHKLQPLSDQELDDALGSCLKVQQTAVSAHNKRPFAAVLLGPDNSSILLTHFSISHFQHAESELARLAAIQYSPSWLAACTLVSTWEPCAMCAGTIYWAGIGRVVYAASESKLQELTGAGNEENMTMNLPCRTVLNAGQRDIEVIGPVSKWEDRVVEESGKWWKMHENTTHMETSRQSLQNGARDPGVVSLYNPDESMLGSVDEEGEYQADLKIDWMS